MDFGLVQTYLFFSMTGITDLIPLFFQQKLWDQAMSEVAVFTFFLFDDKMDVLHPQVLIGELFVTVQTFFLRKPSPCSSRPSEGPSLWRLRTSK
jgi:hypothetical protein